MSNYFHVFGILIVGRNSANKEILTFPGMSGSILTHTPDKYKNNIDRQ